MALNIPINLMGTNAAPATSQSSQSPNASGAEQNDAVQPAPPASAGSNAAENDNSGGQPSNQQQTAITRRPPQAEPTSVLAAQIEPSKDDNGLTAARLSAERAQDAARTKALIEAVAATPADSTSLLDRPTQVDRYAPPDPLPTAPILNQTAPTPIKTTQT